MDRALDDIIDDRPRDSRPRGQRDTRYDRRQPRDYDNAPRDGVRKSYSRNPPRNLEKDWVHDRYDEDDGRLRNHDRYDRYDDYPERSRPIPNDAKLKVENLHFDISENDLKDLFAQVGPVTAVKYIYDRQDRPTGTAFVTFEFADDAAQAIKNFNGADAVGQPIRVTHMPAGRDRGDRDQGRRNPFDSAVRPGRSLFDRIEGDTQRNGGRAPYERDDRRQPNHRDDIDRYVPSRRSPGPIGRGEGRRGPPPGRESGRRPGQRDERRGGADRRGGGPAGARGGRAARARNDEQGRPLVGGRPRKTAEELDAEMNDYWGGASRTGVGEATAGGADLSAVVNGGTNEQQTALDDDIDLMVE